MSVTVSFELILPIPSDARMSANERDAKPSTAVMVLNGVFDGIKRSGWREVQKRGLVERA